MNSKTETTDLQPEELTDNELEDAAGGLNFEEIKVTYKDDRADSLKQRPGADRLTAQIDG